MERQWCVVVPLRLHQAKTRLSTQPAARRRDLVIAMALDVIAASRECPAVTEVRLVADAEGIEAVGSQIAAVLDPGAGLNAAIRAGAHGVSGPVVALLADLPCATPQGITLALSACGAGSGFLCDAEGVGTTMLAAPSAEQLNPHFGVRSRAAHAAAGVPEITDPAPAALTGMRRDVDSEVDLWDALRIGVGAFTLAAAT